jgi:two-component system chemotaxis sensor kinase CheA
MGEMDGIVKEFLVESSENLDQLDRDLVALEKDPTAREVLSSVFRTIHTIKGTSGFLGFSKLESVTHVGENLLSKLRDGKLTLNAEITSGLLALVDAVRQMLASIESTGQDGDRDYPELINVLTGLLTPGAPAVEPPVLESKSTPESVSAAGLPAVAEPKNIGDILMDKMDVPPEQIAAAAEQQQQGDPRHLGEILVERGAVKPGEVLEALVEQKEARGPTASDSTIRVDVGLLDKLMNLVGELVLARNQILQFSTSQQDTSFLNTSQRLNLITTELQEGVMKTRMQPIGNVWSRFPRVVRDLAISCGKQIRIEMEGKETELDKTLIEAIKDPLTHVVRNSVDHGVELPEKRLAAGKSAEGRLLLRAFHEGGQVNIEIADDGAGVNLDRVKQKALDRGLITSDQASRMSDRELLNLLFLPGFSTAEKVTNVSGRGVGMDVVKTNIEKIGGTVDIQSRPGQGTTLKIKIPLTLAIIPALVVTSRNDRYAIPQVSLLELVRLEADQARKGIEMIHGVPVYRLRGNLLPLVYLNRELGMLDEMQTPGNSSMLPANSARASGDRARSSEGEVANIVVLHADGRQFGLVVDDINDTEEIVVKPLGKQLKGISCFAGATIMGDGRVALILDVLGLAQRANVVSEVHDRGVVEKNAAMKDAAEEHQALLLLRGPDDGRMAIPLSLVARLEEFDRGAIEKAEGQLVVQYRGQILPLIHLSSALPERRQEPRVHAEAAAVQGDEKIHVVVYADEGRSVGLVVDKILDIVQEKVEIKSRIGREGTLGSIVVQGRVTEMVDVKKLILSADSEFVGQPVAG